MADNYISSIEGVGSLPSSLPLPRRSCSWPTTTSVALKAVAPCPGSPPLPRRSCPWRTTTSAVSKELARCLSLRTSTLLATTSRPLETHCPLTRLWRCSTCQTTTSAASRWAGGWWRQNVVFCSTLCPMQLMGLANCTEALPTVTKLQPRCKADPFLNNTALTN